jgi:hypothetical protein
MKKPKKEAKRLMSQFIYLPGIIVNYKEYDSVVERAKKSAIITVNEIRRLMNKLQNYEEAVFWNEVKHEIEKL